MPIAILSVICGVMSAILLLQAGPTVNDHTIALSAPPITIAVDRSLRYVGSFAFNVRDVAQAQRIVFADADVSGRVRKLWIAQVEEMVATHAGAYDPPGQQSRRIGPLEFEQASGLYTFKAAITANPGAEAERTRNFLLEKGLHVDGDLIVARFQSVVGQDRRKELVLFYWEDLENAGLPRVALDAMASGPRSERFTEFADRATRTFVLR